MNVKNIKLMAVAAVIIAVCLLFSWVQYGDETPEADDTFDGVWYPAYTYDSGISAEITAPEQLEATVADGSVILTDGVDTAEHILISEHEAVSVSSGVANQLYLEDGILYLISVYNEPDLNGIIYMAMSKDASADLPDDRVDLTGFQVETGWGTVDGTGFTYPGDRAVFAVDSNAFHIARGTIVSGNFDLGFTGFVKSDAEETVMFGYYTSADGSTGMFNAVVIDGEVTATVMYQDTAISFLSAELPISLAQGTMTIDGSTRDVYAENGMVYTAYRTFLAGTFIWTLGEDYVCLENGSLLSYDDGVYDLVIDRMAR